MQREGCIALLCWDERWKGPLWVRAPAKRVGESLGKVSPSVSATHCQCFPAGTSCRLPRYGGGRLTEETFNQCFLL